VENTISLVDLADYENADTRADFIQAFGDGLADLGFVAVTGHSVDQLLLDQAYAAAAETFALDLDVKLQYEIAESGRQRGYTPFGIERAKDQNVADLKEFWHVGPTLPSDHRFVQSGLIPQNVFPSETPAFEEVFTRYFTRVESVAQTLLRALGEYLDLPVDFFEEVIHEGNQVLRILHYPDSDTPPPVGAVRAAAHEDINLITLLPASTKPGLQLMTRSGDWMAVKTPPGVLICDTGDMMQHLTAGRMPSTTHRVVNPEGGSDGGRYSLPFFVHPNPDYVLSPLDPSYGAPVRSHDFLMQRLAEIGLVQK
jgi:isopenicillin N synthase-like dioxygenase